MLTTEQWEEQLSDADRNYVDHIADVSKMVSCGICGDCHDVDNVPLNCANVDG